VPDEYRKRGAANPIKYSYWIIWLACLSSHLGRPYGMKELVNAHGESQ
jgi:hypothetical protein